MGPVPSAPRRVTRTGRAYHTFAANRIHVEPRLVLERLESGFWQSVSYPSDSWQVGMNGPTVHDWARTALRIRVPHMTERPMDNGCYEVPPREFIGALGLLHLGVYFDAKNKLGPEVPKIGRCAWWERWHPPIDARTFP